MRSPPVKTTRGRYKYRKTAYVIAMLLNKENLLIALALTALLLVSGCADFSQPTTSTVTPSPNTSSIVTQSTIESLEDCDKIQDPGKKSYCYSDVATIKKDLSICDRLQEQYKKDTCYSGVASAKQDLSICDKIQDPGWKDYCYQGVAITKQDLSICTEIHVESTKDSCYSDVGIAKQDPSICDKIQNQDTKDACYRYVVNKNQE